MDLFSSESGYTINFAGSHGAGQYLSGGNLIAESYAQTRLNAEEGKIALPAGTFAIAFGYDGAMLR